MDPEHVPTPKPPSAPGVMQQMDEAMRKRVPGGWKVDPAEGTPWSGEPQVAVVRARSSWRWLWMVGVCVAVVAAYVVSRGREQLTIPAQWLGHYRAPADFETEAEVMFAVDLLAKEARIYRGMDGEWAPPVVVPVAGARASDTMIRVRSRLDADKSFEIEAVDDGSFAFRWKGNSGDGVPLRWTAPMR